MENQQNQNIDDFSLVQIFRDFYCKKMESIVVITYLYSIVFIGLLIFFAVRFSCAQTTKGQILYAALIVIMVQAMSVMKVFAFGFIHRNAIFRRLDRIEKQLSEKG